MDSPAPTALPLSRKTLALYAAPCLPLAGVGLPMIVLLPAYFAQDLGLELSVVGLVFTAVRLADIGLDPLLGLIMDRTRSRWGRFRPWMAIGAPIMMLAVALLFFARRGVGPLYLAVGVGTAYFGWSICVLAQSAWGALLSPAFHERSRIYGWWQAFNLIGLLMAVAAPVIAAAAGYRSQGQGVAAVGALLLLLFPLTFALALGGVDEPVAGPSPPSRRADWASLVRRAAVWRVLGADLILGLGFGVQASLFLFYFEAVKGLPAAGANLLLLVYFLAALAGGPAWTMLARRIDKHRALAASCLAYVAGLAALWAIPRGDFGFAVAAGVVAGLPYSAPNLLSRSMLADAGDEDRLAGGADRTGQLYALLNATTKVGAALAVGLTFVGLDIAGFHPSGGGNSGGALMGLSLLFLAAPAALNLAGAALLLDYPLTATRHAQIRAALDRAGL
ncbi:MAG TPA: MFS transporter [Caulobacteraceae bacterium]|nr:MFS transporter [Caulobacteraceae bacterium]